MVEVEKDKAIIEKKEVIKKKSKSLKKEVLNKKSSKKKEIKIKPRKKKKVSESKKLIQDNDIESPWTSNINRLFSRAVVINFTFE